jgi:hypothetical protein
MTRTNGQNRQKAPPQRWATDTKGWVEDFKSANPPVGELINKGCRLDPLLVLLQPCVRPDWGSIPRKKELDQLKREFTGLAVQLEKKATALREMAKRISSGTPAQTASYEDTPEFLQVAASTVTYIAAQLRERQTVIARERNVRTTSALLNFLPLYLYCRKATRDKATLREIANLVNAGRQADSASPELITEKAITEQLKRCQPCSLTPVRVAAPVRADG